MEDAHIHETNIDGKGTCIFGIFDGHGGNSINVIFKEKRLQFLFKDILLMN